MKNYNYQNIYFDNKKILIDVVILILAIVLTFIVLIKYDATEMIYKFTREHEDIEVDEIILCFAISSLYMFIFMIKRFFELKELTLNANTDPLIGILNRRRGSKYILEEIENINTSDSKSSIIMYDIDDFKHINDNYGHDIGDYVLKEISSLVNNEIRANDIFIRWGGEEFLLICSNTTLEEAYNLAERFRIAIESYTFKNNIKITASFGVIELEKNEDFRKQIIRVDKNLYKSKENGKNQVVSS